GERSAIPISRPLGWRACAAIAHSGSDAAGTGAAVAATAKAAAADLKGFSQYSAYAAVAGLNNIATRVVRGALSFSSSSHLPAMVGSMLVKPVTLPPGRG